MPAPFVRGVLATEHRRCAVVSPHLDQMVEDVDRFLRVPIDREVVYEQQRDFQVVPDLLCVPGQVLTLEHGKTVQHLAVVHELAPDVPPAGLDAAGCKEVRLPRVGNPVDTHILPVSHEGEGMHLPDRAVIVDPAVAGLAALDSGVPVQDGTQPEVDEEAVVSGLQVLVLQYFPDELDRRVVRKLRAAGDLVQPSRHERESQDIQHLVDVSQRLLHRAPPSSCRRSRFSKVYRESSSLNVPVTGLSSIGLRRLASKASGLPCGPYEAIVFAT